MNKGFRIEIQKGLTDDEYKSAIKFVDHWVADVMAHGCSWKHKTRAGYSSYYRRGRYGQGVWDPDTGEESNTLVFRRHTLHKRIFAVVRIDTLESRTDTPLKLDQCVCPIHRGGQKVKYKTRPETDIYLEVGDIKG